MEAKERFWAKDTIIAKCRQPGDNPILLYWYGEAKKAGYEQALKDVGERLNSIWWQETGRATDMTDLILTLKKGVMP